MRAVPGNVVCAFALFLAASLMSSAGRAADDESKGKVEGPEFARLRGELDGLRADVRKLTELLETLNKRLAAPAVALPSTARVVSSTPVPISKATGVSGPGSVPLLDAYQLLAPGEPVRGIAISADRRWGASAGWNGTIHVWDLAARREHAVIQIAAGPLYGIVFSPDGKTAYVGGSRNVYVIDVAGARQVRTIAGVQSSVEEMALSVDGRTLATSGGNLVQLWDTATGKETKSVKLQFDFVRAVDLAPDGKLLCVGGYSNSSATQVTYFVRLWDVDSGKNAFRLDHPVRTSFRDGKLSPDGKSIFLIGPDGTLAQWDVATGKSIRSFEDDVTCVTISADGKTLASAGTNGTLKLRDAATGRTLQSLTLDDSWPASISLSADGRSLLVFGRSHRVSHYQFGAVSSASDATNPTTVATNIPPTKPGPQPLQRLRGHESYIYALAVSPDGQWLASGGFDYSLRLWDLESGRQLKNSKPTLSSGIVKDIAFLPDGKRLLVGGGATRGTQRLAIWDVATWRPTVKFEGHDHAVTTVAVSPDGKIAASGSSDATARLWDVATGVELHKLTAHTNKVLDVVFSSDGSTLATCSADGSLRLWDVATGRELRKLPTMAQTIAFHPNKAQLAVGSGMIEMWDYEKATRMRSFWGSTRSIGDLCFSTSGDRLLSGGRGGEVWLLNVDDGKSLLKVPAGDGTHPSPVAFIAKGRQFLTVSTDHVIEFWEVP